MSALRDYIATLRFSPTSGRVPVAAAVSIFTVAISVPGLSQISASSGETFNTRMLGSSAESHQAFVNGDHKTLIACLSDDTVARPVTETYFCPPVSAKASVTMGKRTI